MTKDLNLKDAFDGGSEDNLPASIRPLPPKGKETAAVGHSPPEIEGPVVNAQDSVVKTVVRTHLPASSATGVYLEDM